VKDRRTTKDISANAERNDENRIPTYYLVFIHAFMYNRTHGTTKLKSNLVYNKANTHAKRPNL